jgi:chemotaxis protein methyltransferase CheR
MRMYAGGDLHLSEVDYNRFHDLVRAKTGLDLPESRRVDLEQAVQQLLAETNSPGTEILYRLLLANSRPNSALDALIAKVTVGETYFFRNRPQFEALARHILPNLIERRKETRTLRVWSAGCASGEEPYSLAILLQRLLPDIARWSVLILATDINPRALEQARRASYGAWSFREVVPDIQANYFMPRGRELEVTPRIREAVTIAYLNLVEDVYPSLLTNTNAMDLILCRNVLMYFRQETIRRVVGRLHEALAPGGWLVVGHAEPTQTIFQQFLVHNFPGTVVYQKQVEQSLPQPTWVKQWPSLVEVTRKPPENVTAFDAAPHSFREMPASRSESTKATGTLVAQPQGPSGSYGKPTSQEALAQWEMGQPDEALRLLKALANSKRGDAYTSYLIAKIHANLLELEAAEGWIDRALQNAPFFAPAHYLRALILQEQSQLARATESLRCCVYADPHFVLGHFAQAGLFARLGQRRRQLKALDNVTRLLATCKREDLVPEGDGLTVGRLIELVALHREL